MRTLMGAFDAYALKAVAYSAVDYQADRATAIGARDAEVEPSRSRGAGKARNGQRHLRQGRRALLLVRPCDVRVIEAAGDYSRDYFQAYAPLLYRPLGAIENAVGAGEVLPRQPIAKVFICLFLRWMEPSVESVLEHAHLSMK
ncbi:hypothetical protein [Xanthomonas arboricola]|uniref:hypothetical protein n=2 Tax=Xanthomonas arboricola TaxID=56448 RepID=UPI0036D82691